MSTLTIVSVLLACGAFLLFARGMVLRASRGVFGFPGVLPVLGLILGSVLFRYVFGNEGWGETTMKMLRDVGIGMLTGSILLFARRQHPLVLFVPGLLALASWGVLRLIPPVYEKVKELFAGREAAAQGPAARLLVEMGPDDNVSEIQPILDQFGATAEKAFPMVSMDESEDLAQYLLVRCPAANKAALLAALRQDREDIDQADEDWAVKLEPETAVDARKGAPAFVANDPEAASQWALQAIDAGPALEYLKARRPAKKAKVAIIDTGVEGAHEDLREAFAESPAPTDPHGHGTHCAGLAAAVTNNGKGMASLNWEGRYLRVAGYRALNADGSGSIETVAEAIIQAAEDGADVISLSLGGPHGTAPKAELDAIKYALAKGAIVVAAAGNDGGNAMHNSPANIPGVIVVAATDPANLKTSFSSLNGEAGMPIAAPGQDILSLKAGGGYVAYSGTSMATPIVSGLAGVLRALNPGLSAAQVYAILKETGADTKDSGDTGRLVNAAKAVRAAGI